ncbi:orotate phosphoribosyltransferase [Acidobacteriota bacterium]
MKELQKNFVRFLIDEEVLRFGQFTLKDGRSSPYFLNFGVLSTGRQIHEMGRFFAEGISNLGYLDRVDILFGPAYKGIAIAAATAAAIYTEYGKDLYFAYNRKERKGHGEGGMVVGIEEGQSGRVLIIDDVFSGGKSKDEALRTVKSIPGLTVEAIIVGVDRQEKGKSGATESETYSKKRGLDLLNLVTAGLIATILKEDPSVAARYSRENLEAFLAHLSA